MKLGPFRQWKNVIDNNSLLMMKIELKQEEVMGRWTNLYNDALYWE